jgi:hypothetical protein
MNENVMNQSPRGKPIGIKDTYEVTCDKCKGSSFIEVSLIRKVSAIMTGTGKPQYIPIPAFACVSCNNVNDEFIPEELKNKIQLS